jgi:hypothetical protein
MQQEPYTTVKGAEFSDELDAMVRNFVSVFRKAFDDHREDDLAASNMGDDLNLAASLVDTMMFAIIQELVKQNVELRMDDIQSAFNSIWNTLQIEAAAAANGGMN